MPIDTVRRRAMFPRVSRPPTPPASSALPRAKTPPTSVPWPDKGKSDERRHSAADGVVVGEGLVQPIERDPLDAVQIIVVAHLRRWGGGVGQLGTEEMGAA